MTRNDATSIGSPGLIHRELSARVLGVFFQVHHEMGFGFAESVYSAAMALALRHAGISAEREVPIAVFFRGVRVGSFRADIIVESTVLVELKASKVLDAGCDAQVLNYLRATKLEVALVLHFGERPTFKRLVFSDARKSS